MAFKLSLYFIEHMAWNFESLFSFRSLFDHEIDPQKMLEQVLICLLTKRASFIKERALGTTNGL